MPELPEVETVRRDLQKHIAHKTIDRLTLSHTKVIRPTHARLKKVLIGNVIAGVDRVGKLLIIQLTRGDEVVLVHLKMTGQLIYRDKKTVIAGGHSLSESIQSLPNKHTRAIIHFTDGSELFFNDMRLFAYLTLADEKELIRVKSTYGIEPGTAAFTKEAFQNIFVRRTAPVKAVLLNQKLIAGVGNIYADEACFLAHIRPMRRANTLTKKEIDQLWAATEKVIVLGIEKRGTTFNHFVDGDGNKGGFLPFLRVYGRAGESCKKCKTPIVKTHSAGRGTHYCPTCQK
jgi:formamidopyrimidine-DNA glycosylase